MIYRDLDKLQSDFREVYLAGFQFCRGVLGIDIRTAETLRSLEDQKADFLSGASKNEIGKHNFGRAADFDIYVDGVLQTDDSSGLYLRCGFVFMALGLRWGGNWDRDKNIAEKGESDFRHVEAVKPSTEELKLQAGLTA